MKKPGSYVTTGVLAAALFAAAFLAGKFGVGTSMAQTDTCAWPVFGSHNCDRGAEPGNNPPDLGAPAANGEINGEEQGETQGEMNGEGQGGGPD
jgi:hypothetical protein